MSCCDCCSLGWVKPLPAYRSMATIGSSDRDYPGRTPFEDPPSAHAVGGWGWLLGFLCSRHTVSLGRPRTLEVRRNGVTGLSSRCRERGRSLRSGRFSHVVEEFALIFVGGRTRPSHLPMGMTWAGECSHDVRSLFCMERHAMDNSFDK